MQTITNNTISNVAQNDNASATISISGLVEERKQWEAGVYRTSNLALYAILSKCLSLNNTLSAAGYRSEPRKQFDSYAERLGVTFKGDSKLVYRVVKVVFYNEAADKSAQRDRRRISAYSTVLRRALSDGITPVKLSDWIEASGGIEQIRLAKGANVVATATKVAQAKEVVETSDHYMAVVKNDILNSQFGSEDYGHARLLIVIPRQNGTVEVRAVVKGDGAVNASLAAHYKTALGNTLPQQPNVTSPVTKVAEFA